MRRGSSNMKALSECAVIMNNVSLPITVRLGYYKFCATCVPKMLTGAHKTQRVASVFVGFFRAIPQR
jgi:hypothetical protein